MPKVRDGQGIRGLSRQRDVAIWSSNAQPGRAKARHLHIQMPCPGLLLAAACSRVGENLVCSDDLAVARAGNEGVVFKLLPTRDGDAIGLQRAAESSFV